MPSTTIEEAAQHQRELHALADEGILATVLRIGNAWRWDSLHPDYEARLVPSHGSGVYSVHKETGEVCLFKGKWFGDDVLLCTDCWEDGT